VNCNSLQKFVVMEEQKKDTMKVYKPPRKSSIALPIISVEETPSACSLVWPSSSQPINENDEEAEDNSQFCKKEDDEKTSSGFVDREEDEMKNGLSGSTLQSDQSNMILKRRMTFATSGSVSSSTFTSIRRTLSEETQYVNNIGLRILNILLLSLYMSALLLFHF